MEYILPSESDIKKLQHDLNIKSGDAKYCHIYDNGEGRTIDFRFENGYIRQYVENDVFIVNVKMFINNGSGLQNIDVYLKFKTWDYGAYSYNNYLNPFAIWIMIPNPQQLIANPLYPIRWYCYFTAPNYETIKTAYTDDTYTANAMINNRDIALNIMATNTHTAICYLARFSWRYSQPTNTTVYSKIYVNRHYMGSQGSADYKNIDIAISNNRTSATQIVYDENTKTIYNRYNKASYIAIPNNSYKFIFYFLDNWYMRDVGDYTTQTYLDPITGKTIPYCAIISTNNDGLLMYLYSKEGDVLQHIPLANDYIGGIKLVVRKNTFYNTHYYQYTSCSVHTRGGRAYNYV